MRCGQFIWVCLALLDPVQDYSAAIHYSIHNMCPPNA